MPHLLTMIIALVAGFAGAGLWQVSGLAPDTTRDYLLANPEVLPEAMDVLNQRQMLARLEPLRQELEQPFPGAVLGNPQGSVTMVEFSDYACGFCRQSVSDVQALIAANPDLRVVVRELPILSEGSRAAARMALAAAQQGRFAQFHEAMFAADGPSPDAIEAAALAAGVDLAEASSAIESGAFEVHLRDNLFMAQSLGFNGTPSWVVGDRMLNGAVGQQQMAEAIAEAQTSS